jgi:hypothetical protein
MRVFNNSLAGLVATLLMLVPVATMASSQGDQIGEPIFTVAPTGSKPGQHEVTVSTWTGKFSRPVQGKTNVYPYTMVGTNPWAGSAITTVPSEIIPIALIFSNGRSLDGGAKVASTIASPIFQPFASDVGFTQFGDAVYRTSFYDAVRAKSPDWHVLLSAPAVFPTQTITVPAENGFEFNGSSSGASIGLIDIKWFHQQLERLIKTLDIDPHTLPIFLTYNSFLFAQNPQQCCVIGFHSAVASPGPGNTQNVNTYVWASYSDPRIFGVPIEDITALSHEVAEWYTDPLIRNTVPAWVQPNSGVCFSNLLEVGDVIQAHPSLSFRIRLNGAEYHPQDVALFSWFTGQSPSIALDGRYSYRGDKLSAPAAQCLKQ